MQRGQLLAGLRRLRRVGVALDQGTEFADASVSLLCGQQGFAFVKLRGGDLCVVRKLLDEVIVALDGGRGLLSADVNLADVVVAVACEIVVGIGLDEVCELAGCDRVFGADASGCPEPDGRGSPDAGPRVPPLPLFVGGGGAAGWALPPCGAP